MTVRVTFWGDARDQRQKHVPNETGLANSILRVVAAVRGIVHGDVCARDDTTKSRVLLLLGCGRMIEVLFLGRHDAAVWFACLESPNQGRRAQADERTETRPMMVIKNVKNVTRSCCSRSLSHPRLRRQARIFVCFVKGRSFLQPASKR